MNDETLLIISIGLCFGLVLLASQLGFSVALGAFLMGAILAETIEGEHIEHLTKNIKDLFGAVFFVSVGMMVNPATLLQYWFPILVLTLVTIFGKTFSSFLGVLLSGQPMKISLQSGFSLAQIGEFAFIIAALGYSLGVMREFIYPIIIAISVITTFTTPYFIRLANPFYKWLDPKLSPKLKAFLENYSSGGDFVKKESDWRKLMKFYLISVIVYSVLSIAIILCFNQFVNPFVANQLADYISKLFINLINSLLTIIGMTPFLMGLITTNRKKKEIVDKLILEGNRANRRRLAILALLRLFLATFLVTVVIFINFETKSGLIGFISLAIVVFLFAAHKNFKTHHIMEERFLSNLNQKEELERKKSPLRTSFLSQLSNEDIHLAKITVSADSPLIGKTIKELDPLKNYNINIAKIIRGHKEIYFPKGKDFIFPSDQLVLIGTDEQVATFSQITEIQEDDTLINKHEIELSSFVVKEDSPVLGKNITNSGIRISGCMIIKVDRGEEAIINPDSTFTFEEGDLIWIAGEKEKIQGFV